MNPNYCGTGRVMPMSSNLLTSPSLGGAYSGGSPAYATSAAQQALNRRNASNLSPSASTNLQAQQSLSDQLMEQQMQREQSSNMLSLEDSEGQQFGLGPQRQWNQDSQIASPLSQQQQNGAVVDPAEARSKRRQFLIQAVLEMTTHLTQVLMHSLRSLYELLTMFVSGYYGMQMFRSFVTGSELPPHLRGMMNPYEAQWGQQMGAAAPNAASLQQPQTAAPSSGGTPGSANGSGWGKTVATFCVAGAAFLMVENLVRRARMNSQRSQHQQFLLSQQGQFIGNIAEEQSPSSGIFGSFRNYLADWGIVSPPSSYPSERNILSPTYRERSPKRRNRKASEAVSSGKDEEKGMKKKLVVGVKDDPMKDGDDEDGTDAAMEGSSDIEGTTDSLFVAVYGYTPKVDEVIEIKRNGIAQKIKPLSIQPGDVFSVQKYNPNAFCYAMRATKKKEKKRENTTGPNSESESSDLERGNRKYDGCDMVVLGEGGYVPGNFIQPMRSLTRQKF